MYRRNGKVGPSSRRCIRFTRDDVTNFSTNFNELCNGYERIGLKLWFENEGGLTVSVGLGF